MSEMLRIHNLVCNAIQEENQTRTVGGETTTSISYSHDQVKRLDGAIRRLGSKEEATTTEMEKLTPNPSRCHCRLIFYITVIKQ